MSTQLRRGQGKKDFEKTRLYWRTRQGHAGDRQYRRHQRTIRPGQCQKCRDQNLNDNVTIFDEIAKGNADLMITDASETRYQQRLHPGVLCAVHPETPFDFAEKAYWIRRDAALKAFVDQWLHIAMEDGSFRKIYAAWFE
jgi:membrane-bound lytic murein transglycosylase MltF